MTSTPHLIGAVERMRDLLLGIREDRGFNHTAKTVSCEYKDEIPEALRPYFAIIVDPEPHNIEFKAGPYAMVTHRLRVRGLASYAFDQNDDVGNSLRRLAVATRLEDDIIAALGGDLDLDDNVTLSRPSSGEYEALSYIGEGASKPKHTGCVVLYELTYERGLGLTNPEQ